MQTLQLTIPAQSDDPAGLKIKPREVQSWLDNLPFLDLERSTRLAREQLRLMNRQTIATGARLQILGQFLAIYQRLVEAIAAQNSHAKILLPLVKRLCQDIGFGYKIVVNQLVNRRSGFIESRHLPLALLGSIHTLGLQLLDCYSHYQRAPRALWSECLALYGYTWKNSRVQYSATLPGFGEQQIDANFRLTALMRLADPYQLPSGMAIPVHQYLAGHIALTRIHAQPSAGQNCFQLKEAFQSGAGAQDLYLEVDELLERVQLDIGNLEQQKQSRAIGMATDIPSNLLLHGMRQTLDHWLHHPTRIAEREETHARIELVNGLHAAYCVINRQRPFDPALFLTPGQATDIQVTANPSMTEPHKQALPESFSCTSLNRSSGGLAVLYRGDKKPFPQVGQLVALQRPESTSANHWVVAACRWLIEAGNNSGFEMGLQYLTRDPRAVVIRLMDASGLGGEHEPAIAAVQKRGQEPVHTLITRSGEIQTDSQLTLYEDGNQHQIRCLEQIEDCPGYQRFIYTLINA